LIPKNKKGKIPPRRVPLAQMKEVEAEIQKMLANDIIQPSHSKTLQFVGFGETFCSWMKTFYNDISSCIINNGHCSDYFKLGMGVR
jgi:hypothetical protein